MLRPALGHGGRLAFVHWSIRIVLKKPVLCSESSKHLKRVSNVERTDPSSIVKPTPWILTSCWTAQKEAAMGSWSQAILNQADRKDLPSQQVVLMMFLTASILDEPPPRSCSQEIDRQNTTKDWTFWLSDLVASFCERDHRWHRAHDYFTLKIDKNTLRSSTISF